MSTPVFLFFSVGAERLAAYAIKCLAVGGGFLVGYFAGGVIAFALDRWVFAKKSPDALKKVIRMLGGLLLAILVAMIVFGDGGGGGLLGGTGSEGVNKGTPNPETPGKTDPATPKDDKAKPAPSPVQPADPRPTEVTIRVTVLGGGDVANERFYLIDDDRTPKTLQEVKDAVTARKAAEKRKTVVAILFPPKNALPREHSAVTRLAKWANEDAGLDVTFPAVK